MIDSGLNDEAIIHKSGYSIRNVAPISSACRTTLAIIRRRWRRRMVSSAAASGSPSAAEIRSAVSVVIVDPVLRGDEADAREATDDQQQHPRERRRITH